MLDLDLRVSWAGRELPFPQPYFRVLSSSLGAGTQSIEELLRLLGKAEPFCYAGILFRPVAEGWLCSSPRRADGSRRTQRLSEEEAEDLQKILAEVRTERLEETASPEEEEVPTFGSTGPVSQNRSFWAEFCRVLLEYFVKPRYTVIYWVRYGPRKQKQAGRPPPPRRGARGRPAHGWKTVSRHFLRQQSQLEPA